MARRKSSRMMPMLPYGVSLLVSSAAAAVAQSTMATMPVVLSGGITTQDYPRRALGDEAQGQTDALLTITPKGRAIRCLVTRSSGHEILDSRVCKLALKRLRFSPALDATGRPIGAEVTLPVIWTIHDLPVPPASPL